MNEKKIRTAISVLTSISYFSPKALCDVIKLLNDVLVDSDVKKEPENRFYKRQPVIVFDDVSAEYRKVYLRDIKSDQSYPFKVNLHGSDVDQKDSGHSSYKSCKPDESARSIINWIKWHGGDRPVDMRATGIVLYRNGCVGNATMLADFIWNHTNSGQDIVAYATIDKPEYFDNE